MKIAILFFFAFLIVGCSVGTAEMQQCSTSTVTVSWNAFRQAPDVRAPGATANGEWRAFTELHAPLNFLNAGDAVTHVHWGIDAATETIALAVQSDVDTHSSLTTSRASHDDSMHVVVGEYVELIIVAPEQSDAVFYGAEVTFERCL